MKAVHRLVLQIEAEVHAEVCFFLVKENRFLRKTSQAWDI